MLIQGRFQLVALVLVCMVMPIAAAADVTGSYSCRGTNPDGAPYQGTTVISKNGGGYTLKWTIGSTGQTGTGILTHGAAKQKEDDLLSASFGARGHAFGVVVYRVKDDGRLVGKWLNPSGGSFGTETLTPR